MHIINRVAIGTSFTFCSAVAYRKYENNNFSWKNAALNIALNPLRILEQGPYKENISVDKIKTMAESESGLHDFRGLENGFVFMDKLFNSPSYLAQKYSNFGYIMAEGSFKTYFTSSLQINNYLTQIPSISTIPVNKPVFVTGLFRSGTTLLHRLLALDPQFRSPTLWELITPTPSVVTEDLYVLKTDREQRRAKDISNNNMARDIGGWDQFDVMHKAQSTFRFT
jgi:hypothetical protein